MNYEVNAGESSKMPVQHMLAAFVLAIFGSIASRQTASIPVLGVSTLALNIRSQASASAQTHSSRVVSWALLRALCAQAEGKLCAMYFEPLSSMCRSDASDPRLLGRRSLDGRQQWLQKLRMEEPLLFFIWVFPPNYGPLFWL